MTNINDIADLAQVLQDNPQWRDIIRPILLGDEMLEIPGRIADLISVNEMIVERLDRLEAGQAKLESSQTRLESGQARLESGMTNLSSRFGNIIGSDYERRAAQSARRLVRLGLGIRRARVLLAKTAPDRNEIPELLNEAAENGIVSDDEADDLLLADIILTGEGAGGRRRTPSAKPPSPSTTRTCSGPRGAPEYSKGPQASPSSPPSSVSPPPRGHWTWRTGRTSRSSAPRTKTARNRPCTGRRPTSQPREPPWPAPGRTLRLHTLPPGIPHDNPQPTITLSPR